MAWNTEPLAGQQQVLSAAEMLIVWVTRNVKFPFITCPQQDPWAVFTSAVTWQSQSFPFLLYLPSPPHQCRSGRSPNTFSLDLALMFFSVISEADVGREYQLVRGMCLGKSSRKWLKHKSVDDRMPVALSFN